MTKMEILKKKVNRQKLLTYVRRNSTLIISTVSRKAILNILFKSSVKYIKLFTTLFYGSVIFVTLIKNRKASVFGVFREYRNATMG